jgi:hypothetical protein
MKCLICILGLFNCLITLHCQTKVLYHEYRPTDSGISNIIRWDIPDSILPKWNLKETVDGNGRVVELQFYDYKKLNDNHVCGFIPWIKFYYPNDSTISESYFDCKGNLMGDIECGNPSQIKYYLAKDKKTIIRYEMEIFIDTLSYLKNGYSKEKIMQISKELKLNFILKDVEYYSMSKAKLNLISPAIPRNDKIDDKYK